MTRRARNSPPAGGEHVSILDHVLALLAEMDLRYQQRFDAQIKALDAALLAAEKAVQTALTAAEKAVTKAEIATERRIEGLNELRSIVQDVGALQMPRSEAEQRLTALSEKIEEVKTTAGTSRDKGLGLDNGWKILIAAATLALGIWLAFH